MATSVTLQNVLGQFPEGTSVGAYKRSNFTTGAPPTPGTAPTGSADATATVTNGNLAFTGLTTETEYVATASVSSTYPYRSFTTFDADHTPSGASSVETELPPASTASDSDTNTAAPAVIARGAVWDGGNWTLARRATGDDLSSSGLPAMGPLVYDSSDNTWDRPRKITTFKHFASTAITAGTGATIWTPTAGKKFRVMGISISSSAAGQLLFGDNVVGTVIARSESLAAGGAWKLGAADMGHGILSAAANNVLKLDGPTGNVMGMVFGTEE